MSSENAEKPLAGKTVLYMGAGRYERSINGHAAVKLAGAGALVLAPHLGLVKPKFANLVVEKAKEVGGVVVPIKADASDPDQRRRLVNFIAAKYGEVNMLVQGISAGLYKDETFESAYNLNVTAVVDIANRISEIMPEDGESKVITLPSKYSMYYGQIESLPSYGLAGQTKHLEEITLGWLPKLRNRNIPVGYVCGEAVEGTSNVGLLRMDPVGREALEKVAGFAPGGRLPTIEEMAEGIFQMAINPLQHGDITFVGINNWDRAEVRRQLGVNEKTANIKRMVFPEPGTTITYFK
jgi:3-oxoacyl-[acyl-carrier protein] reductase